MTVLDKRMAALLAVVGGVVLLLGSRGTAEFSAHMAMDISQRIPLVEMARSGPLVKI